MHGPLSEKAHAFTCHIGRLQILSMSMSKHRVYAQLQEVQSAEENWEKRKILLLIWLQLQGHEVSSKSSVRVPDGAIKRPQGSSRGRV